VSVANPEPDENPEISLLVAVTFLPSCLALSLFSPGHAKLLPIYFRVRHDNTLYRPKYESFIPTHIASEIRLTGKGIAI
jgi:hypothetical protein